MARATVGNSEGCDGGSDPFVVAHAGDGEGCGKGQRGGVLADVVAEEGLGMATSGEDVMAKEGLGMAAGVEDVMRLGDRARRRKPTTVVRQGRRKPSSAVDVVGKVPLLVRADAIMVGKGRLDREMRKPTTVGLAGEEDADREEGPSWTSDDK
ncbi:hypothetical protein BHM03_00015477 [Ensete ventricosum]|nr:hypothetical protein BHM03_00015477 [Ensete ventricosum]